MPFGGRERTLRASVRQQFTPAVVLHELNAGTALVQINEYAAIGLRDGLESRIDQLAAITILRMEDVAIEAMRMDAHQHVALGADIAMDQRKMQLAVNLALVTNGFEGTERGVHMTGGIAFDQLFRLGAIADEVGHRDHLEAVLPAEFDQLRNPRHGSVFIHDFADDAAWR